MIQIAPEYDLSTDGITDHDRCKALWMAVLETAVQDIKEGHGLSDGQGEYWRDQAYAWINSSQRDAFNSFINLCEYFNLDHNHIRKSLGI